MSNRLVSEVAEIGDISQGERKELFALFEECYESICYDRFCDDFFQKDHVVILKDRRSDRVKGFSTQQIEKWRWQGGIVRTVFSGDTIVHPDYWGEQELVRAWCRYASWVRAQDSSPLYWFLISKGYRTYLYLSLFCKRFYPHYDRKESSLADLAGYIANQKFGEFYDADRGVLSFAKSQGHLKPEFAEIPKNRIGHRHVAYFLKRNPGYIDGEELVCLAELSDQNVRSIAARYFLEPQAPRAVC